MREMLFKGKRLDNGEWVEGTLFVCKHYETDIDHYYILPTNTVCLFCDIFYYAVEVDPSTVCQFTELCDKNGKKIFEGDIVDASDTWWDACGPAGHDSPIIPVEWDDNNCGFNPFADYDCDCGVYICAWRCEIIGNIHDNPELLK